MEIGSVLGDGLVFTDSSRARLCCLGGVWRGRIRTLPLTREASNISYRPSFSAHTATRKIGFRSSSSLCRGWTEHHGCPITIIPRLIIGQPLRRPPERSTGGAAPVGGPPEVGLEFVGEESNHASTSFTSTSAAARGSRPTTATETDAEASAVAVNQTSDVTRRPRISGRGCRVLRRLSVTGDAAMVPARRAPD